MFYFPVACATSHTNKNGIVPTPNLLRPFPLQGEAFGAKRGPEKAAAHSLASRAIGTLPRSARSEERVQASALDGSNVNPAAELGSRDKVKFRKIVPYNISEYLTPLALAV